MAIKRIFFAINRSIQEKLFFSGNMEVRCHTLQNSVAFYIITHRCCRR